MFHQMEMRFPRTYSYLRRVAILRKGRKIGHQLKKWIKDHLQKRILDKGLDEFSVDQLINLRDNVIYRAATGESAARWKILLLSTW